MKEFPEERMTCVFVTEKKVYFLSKLHQVDTDTQNKKPKLISMLS